MMISKIKNRIKKKLNAKQAINSLDFYCKLFKKPLTFKDINEYRNEVFLNSSLSKAYSLALEKYIFKLNPLHRFSRFEDWSTTNTYISLIDFLYIPIRHFGFKYVLETGCASGLTSSLILAALKKNGAGKLFSIDLSIESQKNDVTGFDWPSDVPIGYLIPSEFKKNHELIFGDSVIELPKLLSKKKSEGINFDLFFHDSDHSYSHMTYEFSIVDKYRSTAPMYVVSDDTRLNPSFKNYFYSSRRYYSILNRNIGVCII